MIVYDRLQIYTYYGRYIVDIDCISRTRKKAVLKYLKEIIPTDILNAVELNIRRYGLNLY